jgi:hypothetical protein
MCASHTVAFSMNDEKLMQLTELRKKQNRMTISVDLFAKELLYQRIDALLKEGKK